MPQGLGQDQIKRARTAKTAVLKVLADNKWHRFGKIVEATKISAATVSKYLKEFEKKGLKGQKGKLVEKRVDVESGEYPYPAYYRMTEYGQKALTKWEIAEEIETFPNIYDKTELEKDLLDLLHGKNGNVALASVESLHDLQPEGKVFVDTLIYSDEDSQEKLDTILGILKEDRFGLRYLATRFVERLGNAIIDAKGARYNWGGFETGPWQKRKVILQDKVGLDFDATLVLHFDGREIVKRVDWENYLKEVGEGDHLMREGWKRFVENVEESGVARKNWITDGMIDKFREQQTALEKLLGSIFPEEIEKIAADGPWEISDEEEKLKERFVESVARPRFIIEDPRDEEPTVHPEKPVEEVKEVMEELLKEGVVEIVPIYFFKLNKDKEKINKKQWEAKAGYTDPVHLIANRKTVP